MVIKAPQVKTILTIPEKAAEIANLVYVTDPLLTIERRPRGRGFYYLQQGKKISDKEAINRFKALVIPPAWKDVRITHLPNGHLQVVGKDDRKRKQYRYHPVWSKLRNQTKFLKMTAFGTVLPEIRRQVEIDLELPRMTKRKCLALIIRLMEETHIRIGNDYYARRNKTYGLTTMRSKHLDIYKNNLKFNFTGKKGKEHSVTIRNKKLQKLVLQCMEIPGWEVFKYYDEDGVHQSIDSGMVNDYIHELCGAIFSAKDFRTWAGTKVFFESLYELGIPEKKKDREKNILEAYDRAAAALGNTRNVCRKYYVHPYIAECYLDGSIQKSFDKTNIEVAVAKGLTSSEIAMLDLIDRYSIKL